MPYAFAHPAAVIPVAKIFGRRAVPSALAIGSMIPDVWYFVPWLDRAPVKSIRYRGPIYRAALMLFAATFIMLGYCGMKPPEQPFKAMSVIGTAYYFLFFLLMPWYSRIDSHKREPLRVTS